MDPFFVKKVVEDFQVENPGPASSGWSNQFFLVGEVKKCHALWVVTSGL